MGRRTYTYFLTKYKGNYRENTTKGKRISGNQRGQITVMLSLVLSVILLFLLVCSEGVFLALSKGRFSRNLISAGESALADYQPFLWERYHLFALDKSYGGVGEDALMTRISEYMMEPVKKNNRGIPSLYSYSFSELSIEQSLFYCEDIEILKNQIREYMKYEAMQDSFKQLSSLWNADTSKEVDIAKNKVQQAKQREIEARQIETETGDEGETKEVGRQGDKGRGTEEGQQAVEAQQDPREGLQEALKLGVVELVTGRSDISKESYGLEELEKDMSVTKASEIELPSVSFSSTDEIMERLSIPDLVKEWESEISTETLTASYITMHFSSLYKKNNSFLSNTYSSSMQCQYEYLIAGGDSDYANAKSIINRLIALRFPLNYIYVVKQPAHVAKAQGIAAELVGVTLNPAIVEVVAYLLLACESYAEAILDVRDLVHGGSVPLQKTENNWHVSLTGITQMLLEKDEDCRQTDSPQGLCYEDYLTLLLAIMPDIEQKYRRMICVMDYEGKKRNPNFSMSNMVAGFYLKAGLHIKPVFSGGISLFEQTGYTFKYEKMFSY